MREINQEPVGEILHGGPEIVTDLAPEWRRLCNLPHNHLPFCRPEWVAAYFCKQENARFLIVSTRKSGELKGLLPLIQKTGILSRLPARTLRGPSEYLLWQSDALVASEFERHTVAKELWGLIREHQGWDLIELPNVPKGGVAEELLKAAEREGFRTHCWEYMHSPFFALSARDSAGDPLELARSFKLRKNLRSSMRKMEKEGGLKVHRFERAESDILQRLYELEACVWKEQQGRAVLSKNRERVF